MTNSLYRCVCMSIVSHGQGHLVYPLLCDIRNNKLPLLEVIVTLNIPEDDSFLNEFHHILPLRIVRNKIPRGFGANHNEAFNLCSAPIFIVVNPDIRLLDFSLNTLIVIANQPDTGVAAPVSYSSDRKLLESARKFPTILSLFKRKIGINKRPDYLLERVPKTVDWVSGMFMVFRRDVFESVGGFDERYFMYFEDVDLCYRLQLLGFKIIVDPSSLVIHNAQHTSRRKIKYLIWHMSSAFRFLLVNK